MLSRKGTFRSMVTYTMLALGGSGLLISRKMRRLFEAGRLCSRLLDVFRWHITISRVELLLTRSSFPRTNASWETVHVQQGPDGHKDLTHTIVCSIVRLRNYAPRAMQNSGL